MAKSTEVKNGKQGPLKGYLNERGAEVEKRAMNLLNPDVGHIDLADLALTVGEVETPRRVKDAFIDDPQIRAQRGIALLHGILERPEVTKVLYKKKPKRKKTYSPLDAYVQRSERTRRSLRLIDLTIEELTSTSHPRYPLTLQEDLFVAAVALGQVVAVDRLIPVRDEKGKFRKRVSKEKTVRRLVLHHGLQRLSTESDIFKDLASRKRY